MEYTNTLDQDRVIIYDRFSDPNNVKVKVYQPNSNLLKEVRYYKLVEVDKGAFPYSNTNKP